jgi:hypothetical protein
MTLTGLLVSAAAALTFAQGGQSADGEPPRFRASVQLVQLDVAVTGKDGQPVTTLTREDFEVTQDGKRQVVRFVDYIRVAPEPTASTRTATAPASASTSASASASDSVSASASAAPAEIGGRRIAIVVDDRFMTFESVVRTREA